MKKSLLLLLLILFAVNADAEIKYNSFNILYIQGRFSPKAHSSFVKVEKKYSLNKNIFLIKEAYNSFLRMREHAEKDGINLKILSATRTFNKQKNIWERKWKRSKISSHKKRAINILQFSSMPSTSRHHWGTDIDINSVSSKYFSTIKGQKEYQWLKENASEYGFCQPYTEKGKTRQNGYNEEKWHWSYIPIARKYTNYLKQNMKDDMIQGFLGYKVAQSINIVDNYILGVNTDCL